MNVMPTDWSEQLQSVYPKRSGPSGWKGMKLMLALRRALFDSTWEQIIDGCKNYARYCEEGGKTGSDFVQAPARFIEDGSYLEQFTFAAAVDPKVAAHKAQEALRWGRASELAAHLSVPRYPQDSLEAFESRIRLAETRPPPRRVSDNAGGELSGRIADLANRMRVAK